MFTCTRSRALLLGSFVWVICSWMAAVPVRGQAAPETIFEENVMVPMRDNVRLATNVHRPAEGGPFPVILVRTPYGKLGRNFADVSRYTSAGFAMVVQDCRGRGNSEGEWDPFRYDVEDGLDTQNWVGEQPWCDGQIGTSGGSYVGWTQWAAAAEGSRYLKTMVPVVPFGDVYHEIAYPGGALQLSLLLGWGAGVGGVQVDAPALEKAFSFLPLNQWTSQFQPDVPYVRDWIAHPTYDDYWRQRSMRHRYRDVKVPVLNIGGWYDIFSKTTIELVDRVRDESVDREVRRNQYVIIGPWGHGPGGRKLGELDYGPEAERDLGQVQLDWFRYWLQQQETGVEDWPAYQLFVMGENRWRAENEWPLARTQWTEYYLHSEGTANTRHGSGTLSTQPPGQEHPDKFTYDPANPVPTKGGNNLLIVPTGPFDQSALEERQDILVYTSAPLTSPLEVTGPIKLMLHAATSAKDTDFTAKLVDVHPDGKAYNLCDGILRARYRQSSAEPSLVTPDQVERYEIDMWVTSNVFQTGHCLRVEISSSNFPRFDRNPNTGHPFGSDTELHPAEQTIFHDAEHASHLLLPVIPR